MNYLFPLILKNKYFYFRSMKRKTIKFWILIFLIPLFIQGCLKNKLEPTGDEDIVFSAFDSDADFANYRKYMIVDNIGRIDLSQTNYVDTLIQEPYRTIILNQIDINLLSFGYTKVNSLDSADVFINVNTIVNPSGDLINQYSYIDGNGEYESAWWGSQYYYGATNYWQMTADAVYDYQIPNYFTANSGTLIIEMLDIGSLDTANHKIYIPWISGIRSVLEGNNISNRLISAINQCFVQSPYLNHP